VGSESANDISISDPTVSKQHATVRWRKGRWELTDAGSTNGTFLATGRIGKNPTTLLSGQEIRFGGARFIFQEDRTSMLQGINRRARRRARRRFSLRTTFIVIVGGFVIGFAIMQYLSYLQDRRQTDKMESSHLAQSPSSKDEVPSR
jgi:FHA domain